MSIKYDYQQIKAIDQFRKDIEARLFQSKPQSSSDVIKVIDEEFFSAINNFSENTIGVFEKAGSHAKN